MLGERLSVCAGFVRGERVCDVGTDHGYLAAELLLSGKCVSVIASDINEKPLLSAKRTLTEKGVLSKAELILSDGLKNISLADVSDIVIAGMGGELIFSILSGCDGLKGKNLILQPMTKAEYLRKNLAESGYNIKAEKAVSEKGHLYTVINAEFDGVKREVDEVFCYIGALDKEDNLSKKYIEYKLNSIKKAAEGLSRAGKTTEASEKTALAEKLLETTGGNNDV